jgi:hypothetical protein
MARLKAKAKANTPVEPLPQEKSKNGYLYKLVKRTKKAAMYEQIIEKECNGDVGRTVGFEVFQIIVGKAYSLIQKNGKKKGEVYHYPPMEKFPGNEDFGKTAWAYTVLETAKEKFKEIS